MPSDATVHGAPRIPGLDRTSLPGVGDAYTTTREIPSAGVQLIDLRRYAAIVTAPTKYSIQIGVRTHIDGAGTRYLNHSCDPNVFVDAETISVITLRPLAENEALFFFYPANEWLMTVPFQCYCKSRRCIGTICGAAATPRDVLRRYRLNRHIYVLLAITAAGR
jgi:hypothetical protein